ncbi:hypothetical protein SANA_01240 [Gottschalkiaceae bacterium SANA]|nr:hypothetical protein SANA_01240 [Gottschalkiaceae bacterium SANA]
MEVVKCYEKLCREIENYETRLESLIAQKEGIMKRWLKPLGDIQGIDYTRTRVQGGRQRLDMEEELFRLGETEKNIEKYQALLEKLHGSLSRMKEQIDEMKGLEYKISFMKRVEGKSLLVISEELNYSYGYIRKLSSEMSG